MFQPTPKMEALHKVIYISKAHHAALESRFRTLGMHRTAHMLLNYVSQNEEINSQKELAKLLKVSEAAVANSLVKLEKEDYIRRIPDENDRRKNRMELTPKGAAVIEQSRQFFKEVDNETFAGVSDEEIETLNVILKKIENNLSGTDIPEQKEENSQ